MPITTVYGDGVRVVGSTSQPLLPQPLHPNVQAYVSAQASVGYTMTVNEIDAVNNLVWGMVGSGIWDKMTVVYPCIGNATTGANSFKWNLKNISAKNLAFTGVWTFASTGMQISTRSNAIFADTGYNSTLDMQPGNVHMGIYLRNFSTGSPNLGNAIAGYYRIPGGGGLGGVLIAPGGALNTSWGWCQNSGSSSSPISTAGIVGGLLLVNRTLASTTGRQTLNGLQKIGTPIIGFNTETWSYNFTLGRANYVTPQQTVDPQEFAFVSIGLGLTDSQVATYYTIVQAFQTKLGRQV